MDAYDKGYNAYENGDTIDDNPFDDHDPQVDEWDDGYFDALHDDCE